MTLTRSLLIVFASFLSSYIYAQNTSADMAFTSPAFIDKIIEAGPLKCVQSTENSNHYYYLPNNIILAESENIKEFSFIHYSTGVAATTTSKETSTDAAGGGIVTFLVSLTIPDENKKKGEQELKSKVGNSNAKLLGPLIYAGGTMELICGFVGKDDKVIGIGNAPVIEGDKVAISFSLNALNANLLAAALKEVNTLIALNFNMTLRGYSSPIKYKLKFNWSKIYNHKIFNLGVATPIAAFEIGKTFQELVDDGAIYIDKMGSNPEMDKYVDLLLNKFTEMCFEPLGSEGGVNWSELGKPAYGDRESFLDKASNALEKNKDRLDKLVDKRNQGGSQTQSNQSDTSSGDSSGRRINPYLYTQLSESKPSDNPDMLNKIQEMSTIAAATVQIKGSYQIKKIKQTINMKAEFTSSFPTQITERFGNSLGKLDCAGCYKFINLQDLNRNAVRIVNVNTGELATKSFSDYLNSVDVILRKKRTDGTYSAPSEARIDKNSFADGTGVFNLSYGWNNDKPNDWLKYEYKMTYNFAKGGVFETNWIPADKNTISLDPGYMQKHVVFQSDQETFARMNANSVSIKVYYNLPRRGPSTKIFTLKPVDGRYDVEGYIIVPDNDQSYEYEYTWVLKDGSKVVINKIRTDSESETLKTQN